MIAMLPSVVALVAKLWLFYVASYSLATTNRALAVTILSLGSCNLVELWGFSFVGTQGSLLALVGLKYYYVFLIFSGILLLRLSIELLNTRFALKASYLFVCIGLGLCVPLVGDTYIRDYHSIGYAITRVPGEYYGVLSATLVLSFLLPIFTLGYGAWIKKDKRCKTLFYCSLPILLVLSLALGAMFAGYAVNAAGFLSLATTFFVVGIVYTESIESRFALLSSIPGTEERKIGRYLQSLSIQAATNPQKLKQVQWELDRFVAQRCLQECGGNITHAAQQLGVSPRTFKRKCFDLDENENLENNRAN